MGAYSALYAHLLDDLAGDPSVLPDRGFKSPSGWPGITVREFAAQRLLESFLKKNQDRESEDAEAVAVATWRSCNDQCKGWQPQSNTSADDLLLGEFRRFCWDIFGKGNLIKSWTQIHELGRVGPGSSLGARGTDMYSKLFSSGLASTNDVLHKLWNHNVREHNLWFQADICRSEVHSALLVEGSRLSFVPKNRDTRRSICVEPTLNGYYQLGIGNVLASRLDRRLGIALDTQPESNRKLAKLGSIDGSFGTIDLSSASDTIAYELCRWALPPDVMYAIDLTRCQYTSYKGERIELHMVSSMGNGFTFPLQTGLFAAVVHACASIEGLPLTRADSVDPNWGVFGDDIVVPSKVYNRVVRLLTLLGFRVNLEKSFNDGFFRESCGEEYYSGTHLRGVYIKTLRTQQDRYVAINRLLEWCAEHSIKLPRVLNALLATVKDVRVPPYESYDSGIRVPVCLASPKRLHRYHGSYGYYPFVPRLSRIRYDDSNIPSARARRDGHIYNPYGLLLCLLSGHLRDHSFAVRNNSVRYVQRLTVAPSWDRLSEVNLVKSRFGWAQWVTTVKNHLP